MIKITVITSLYRCSKYLPSYLEHVKKISNPEEVEVLLLHNAPTPEELDIINEGIKDIPFIKHIIIPEREGLYATWNRGVKLAQGEYCAIWNVDDIRFPDSLKKQAEVLDNYPEVAFPYGNVYHTEKYGDMTGRFTNERDCAKLRYHLLPLYSHLVNCFPMWRKSLHDEIGYFDEQFRLAGDYEFQIRAARKYKLKKINEILGCYLSDEPNRLSKNTELQQKEVTAVELRYGIYYKMNLLHFPKAVKYNIPNIESFGKWTPVSSILPGLTVMKILSLPMCLAQLYLFPLNLMQLLKHSLKKYSSD